MNYWTIELLNYWTIELMNYWTIELLNSWTFELLNYWTTELLNYWTTELMNFWTIELLNYWTWNYWILNFQYTYVLKWPIALLAELGAYPISWISHMFMAHQIAIIPSKSWEFYLILAWCHNEISIPNLYFYSPFQSGLLIIFFIVGACGNILMVIAFLLRR